MQAQQEESKEFICVYCDREIGENEGLFNTEHRMYLCHKCIPQFLKLVDAKREPDLKKTLEDTIEWLKQTGRL